MSMGSASGRSELDEVARDLATGEITRRTALVRLLGAGAGVAIAGVPGASAFSRKRCPASRKCGSKCCAKHASCKRGKCKCDGGYSKCGKKCIDLQTSTTNCGSCGNPCSAGEFCVDAECVICRGETDCQPTGAECKHAECSEGACVEADDPDGTACEAGEGWTCFEGTCQCSNTLCGPDDLCTDLNSDSSNCGFCGRACSSGQTCQSGECVTPCSSESDCATSPSGHHCMTSYGVCGCRPGFSDCPPPKSCFSFTGDPSNGFCLDP
ncbi:MAG: hypothetical protein QOI31_2771 [Solirubrobacterales bacterium]|jgi:hypothetical protein|nr:hypothetical protein [Solirubrobacterales bacterium]